MTTRSLTPDDHAPTVTVTLSPEQQRARHAAGRQRRRRRGVGRRRRRRASSARRCSACPLASTRCSCATATSRARRRRSVRIKVRTTPRCVDAAEGTPWARTCAHRRCVAGWLRSSRGVGSAATRRRADRAAHRHRRARRHRLGARAQRVRPLRRGRGQGRAAHQAVPQRRRRRRAGDGRAHRAAASSTASPPASSCAQAVAPSMRVLRLPGVFQSRDEARDVVTRLRADRRGRGGASAASSCSARQASAPTSSSRASRCAAWPSCSRSSCGAGTATTSAIAMSREMGLTIVPTPLHEARRAYDERQHRRLHGRAARRRSRSSGRARRAT